MSTGVLGENPDPETREIMKSHESHACHEREAGIDGQLETSGKRPTAGARPRGPRPKDWLDKKKCRGCVLVP